jgi:four helix bundle protein
MNKAHKHLHVWREAIGLTKLIYQVTEKLPNGERFGLVSQMRRAAVSIPSNIAEGAARQTKKDSLRFYIIARASLSELDTQLELCKSLNFLSADHCIEMFQKMDAVDALLSGLMKQNLRRRIT